MSKKLIESMGMEAKSILNENKPCVLVKATHLFGNWSTMKRLVKKTKGEFKVHNSKIFVPITEHIYKTEQGFTSGLTSFESKDIQIGICSTFYGSKLEPLTIVAFPSDKKHEFHKLWNNITTIASRLPRLKKNSAWTLGSNGNYCTPLKVDIDDVINHQKQEIINSIEGFFSNPQPYIDVGLPPFRKICFAGTPGTGKTMTANGIAKYLLNKYKIQTIYIGGSTMFGCNFDIIKSGIDIIIKMKKPFLMIVEEFDSFCNDNSRSKVLNFLDGFETPNLKYPLCLIMTTNHPDRIDPAIIDRSGRINRVFWFKGIHSISEANKIVDIYSGKLEIPEIGDLLVGKTPDFVKELCIELKWKKTNNEDISRELISNTIKSLGSGMTIDDKKEGYR